MLGHRVGPQLELVPVGPVRRPLARAQLLFVRLAGRDQVDAQQLGADLRQNDRRADREGRVGEHEREHPGEEVLHDDVPVPGAEGPGALDVVARFDGQSLRADDAGGAGGDGVGRLVEQAARCGVRVSFMEFSRAGAPVTVCCLAIALAWIMYLT